VVCNDGGPGVPVTLPGLEAATGRIGSAAALPVCTRGETTHALIFCSSEAGVFDEEIVRTLEQVTAEVSFGIDALATRRDLAAAYIGLERKVEERTRDLAEAKDRAEAADRAKSAFLSSVSHELRSPLHSIIGFTAVLLEGIGGPLNDAQREHVDVVRDSARHLLGIINDLLDISRIEAGAMAIARAPYRPDEVLRRVLQRFRIEAEAKGLEFRLETDGSRPVATGDELRVEQVITNLVSNAIKYTSRGGVLLRSRVVGDGLMVEVEDTGRGIPAGEQERIFARFTQLDPGAGRLAEGTGLGLAIARGLAGAMGGRIEVASEPGRGSRFTLHLPLEAARSAQDARLAG
jgi:signal transduction histidine kinase